MNHTEPDHFSKNPQNKGNKKYKNPLGAALLSFFTIAGFGQFYVGDHLKGLAFVVANIALIFINIGNLWIIPMLILHVWAAADAYTSAQKKNDEAINKHRKWQRH